MIEVIPAILPASFEELTEKIEHVASSAPLVQIDIVDGVYAPEATWPYNNDPEEIFEKILSGEVKLPHIEGLNYEVDLMVQTPESTLEVWLSLGFAHFIVHLESTADVAGVITHIKEKGRKVGLALKPSTANEALEPFIEMIDFVQCMGNEKIGYHGVAFDPSVLEKLADLRARYPKLPLGVDIGVNFETAPRMIAAGATRLASGSLILESDNPKKVIQKLKGEAV